MKRKITNKNGTYSVEKGIPMERKKHVFARFPFDKMKIGDSFFIPKEDQHPDGAMTSIYSAANSYNRFHATDIRVSVRKQEGGLRVWRIADKK